MATVPHDDRVRELQSRATELHRGAVQLLTYSSQLRIESDRLVALSNALTERRPAIPPLR